MTVGRPRASASDPATALTVDPHLTVETDGSFAGLLCGYAACYRHGALPSEVALEGAPASGRLFGEAVRAETDAAVSERVERGLDRAARGLVSRMRRAFLSERPGIDVAILRLAEAVRIDGAAVVEDWTFEPTRLVAQWAQRVGREAHRMEAFVRFERRTATGADGEAVERFVAEARPEHHVLPLLTSHFATRYPTLAWRIVDVRRGLALVHTPAPQRAADQPPTEIVPALGLDAGEHADEEAAYQSMWRAYFRAVTIPERRNLKLHLRHVPKRYWPYLTEKQPERSR